MNQKYVQLCVGALIVTTVDLVAVGRPKSACPSQFGDVNADGAITVVDAQCTILVALWQIGGAGGALPACLGASGTALADLDCSGSVGVGDVQLSIGQVLGLAVPLALDIDADGCPNGCDDDIDGDGYANADDCAPEDPAVYPGAAETCNGIDDNCSGIIDDGPPCADSDHCTVDYCAGTLGCAFAPVDCGDGTACTEDLCDPDTGECVNPIAQGPVLFWSENFEKNQSVLEALGWTFEQGFGVGPAGSTSCQTACIGSAPSYDHSPGPGNRVAGTAVSDAYGSACVFPSILPLRCVVSPPLDLVAAGQFSSLRYRRFAQFQAPPFVSATVDVWHDGLWQNLWSLPASGQCFGDAAWTLVEHDLTPYKSQVARLRWCFAMHASDAFSQPGWRLDDVEVWASENCCTLESFDSGLAGWTSAALEGNRNTWQLLTFNPGFFGPVIIPALINSNDGWLGFEHSAIRSPLLSLPNGGNLTFDSLHIDDYMAQGERYVDVSPDFGGTWHNLMGPGSTSWGPNGQVQTIKLTVPPALGGAGFRVRFRYRTNDPNTTFAPWPPPGWIIDNVAIGPTCGL